MRVVSKCGRGRWTACALASGIGVAALVARELRVESTHGLVGAAQTALFAGMAAVQVWSVGAAPLIVAFGLWYRFATGTKPGSSHECD